MAVINEEVSIFIDTIKSVSTYDFSDYSIKSFTRRVEKLLIDYNMTVGDLTQKVKTNPEFLEAVVKNITVNTTELFRDTKLWHYMRYTLLPKFKQKKSINIWHVGCSTGQEVYSMMILLNELNLLGKTNVYASDINTDVIEKSKKGEFRYSFNLNYLDNFDKVIKENPNNNEYYDVDYSKYFDVNKGKDVIKMNDFLKNKPHYSKYNLTENNGIENLNFDLILCRNVLIYFNFNLQNQIFSKFHEFLYDSGHLTLGMQESILGEASSLFEKQDYVYKKLIQ